MHCGWGVKADMARVCWQVKLCEPLYNTCHTGDTENAEHENMGNENAAENSGCGKCERWK